MYQISEPYRHLPGEELFRLWDHLDGTDGTGVSSGLQEDLTVFGSLKLDIYVIGH